MGLKTGILSGVIVTVVTIVMIFQVMGDTAGDVGNAASNASEICAGAKENLTSCAGNVLPFASLFGKKGLILLSLMAGIALTIILSVMPRG